MTTHFMDEADLLGDRIAIISQGQLKCCGSSLFLKKKFGSGYYVTLVRKERNQQEMGCGRSSQLIRAALDQHIPNCSIVQDIGSDLVIGLPELDENGHDQRCKFPRLFEDLESNMDRLGLQSYGVSDTTLEEVSLSQMTTQSLSFLFLFSIIGIDFLKSCQRPL